MSAGGGPDPRLERLIGLVLRSGVVISSVCLAAGLLLEVLGAGAARPLLNTGVIILLATPVSRVMISVVEYTLTRDWTYVVFTTIVLLELAGSLYAAIR